MVVCNDVKSPDDFEILSTATMWSSHAATCTQASRAGSDEANLACQMLRHDIIALGFSTRHVLRTAAVVCNASQWDRQESDFFRKPIYYTQIFFGYIIFCITEIADHINRNIDIRSIVD